MISRHITCKQANDDYGRLARYVTDASHEGEKCLAAWAAGCWAGDDYELAITEIEDTQALNLRTGKEKTYHLIVSFRPEDEALLTIEKYKEIEKEFAKTLGYEEHQRHCGVHKNTANVHMHVAYNMIHPEKLTRHEPYRDFHKRDKLCRQLEQKYSLKVDNGRNPARDNTRENEKARTYEAHSGQQSFDGYVKDQKTHLLKMAEVAKSWQELHTIFAEQGLVITPRGNGCVIKNRFGKQRIKASSLDRSFSLHKLEARFGKFRPAKSLEHVVERDRYTGKPLHRNPERGNLYREYQKAIKNKKHGYEQCKEQEKEDLEAVRKKWKLKQREIRNRTDLVWKDKKALISLAKLHGLKHEETIRADMAKRRMNLRKETPFHNWSGFLKLKAEQGNQVALAILRSRKETAQAQDVAIPKRLMANISYRVDNQGNVLYSLAGGGMIKDTGSRLFFSKHDKGAQKIAKQLAWRKFGKQFTLGNGVIRRVGEKLEAQIRNEMNR